MRKMKMYNIKHLQDPFYLFERQTQLKRARLRVLLADYNNVKHYISKAIIIDEIEQLVDDLIEREFVLQRNKENKRSSADTRNRTGKA